ncbi:MAG: hypothetical protein KME14_26120 [Tildeniella torsiva UHER 1998/13D]|jgi:hypothetical protein|nr:hypothetical protein [Tildeniella torsiva UHER 1998/13D]
MLLTVPRKKSDYAPGEHPHSQGNLQPRETMYGEAKKRREIMATATGWDGFKALAASMDLSASELVERLGRGAIAVYPPEVEGNDRAQLQAVYKVLGQASGLALRLQDQDLINAMSNLVLQIEARLKTESRTD